MNSSDLSWVIVVSVVAGTYLLSRAGAFVGGQLRARSLRRHPPKLAPTCGCGHDISFHSPLPSGACHHVETVRIEERQPVRDENNKPVLNNLALVQTWVAVKEVIQQRCGCQHYSGPDLQTSIMPTLLAQREIAER
jgi:hypothetical protein